MNISNIITGVCSLLFLSIGADKFLNFLEPPCSLMNEVSPIIWKGLGVIQILAGIFIWSTKFKKYIVGFFAVFMYVFVLVHVSQGTSDIKGALIMGILLSILVWNPSFIRGKKVVS